MTAALPATFFHTEHGRILTFLIQTSLQTHTGNNDIINNKNKCYSCYYYTQKKHLYHKLHFNTVENSLLITKCNFLRLNEKENLNQ